MWTKFDDRFMDRADVSGVSRNARLLLVEAYIYCNRNETDGVFSAADLRKMTDLKRTGPAIKELIAAGLLEEFKTRNGDKNVRWRVDWSDQPARLDNELRRASDTNRQHSKRIRDALHKADIHTRCGHQMYCKQADYVGLSQRDPREASRLESLIVSRHPDQTRPDPTRPGPKGKGEGRVNGMASNSAGAPFSASLGTGRKTPVDAQSAEVIAGWRSRITAEWLGVDPAALSDAELVHAAYRRTLELDREMGVTLQGFRRWALETGLTPEAFPDPAESLEGLLPAGGAGAP